MMDVLVCESDSWNGLCTKNRSRLPSDASVKNWSEFQIKRGPFLDSAWKNDGKRLFGCIFLSPDARERTPGSFLCFRVHGRSRGPPRCHVAELDWPVQHVRCTEMHGRVDRPARGHVEPLVGGLTWRDPRKRAEGVWTGVGHAAASDWPTHARAVHETREQLGQAGAGAGRWTPVRGRQVVPCDWRAPPTRADPIWPRGGARAALHMLSAVRATWRPLGDSGVDGLASLSTFLALETWAQKPNVSFLGTFGLGL